MSIDQPPKAVPIIIKQFDGRSLCGIVVKIDERDKTIKLVKVSLIEVVGLKNRMEPIYAKRRPIEGVVSIAFEDIAHWEKLPDYLEI